MSTGDVEKLERSLEPRRAEQIETQIRSGHPFGPGTWRERWHREGRSGTLRAAIFGMSDGLVSNLALILGVAGSGVGGDVVVVAGIAGLLAGAFSMGVGEYLSMRVQREVFEHALAVEAMEIRILPEQERDELARIYQHRGLPQAVANQVADKLSEDPDRALRVHAREELGLDPDELGSPWGAASSSFGMFAIGAVIPLVPYLLSSGDARLRRRNRCRCLGVGHRWRRDGLSDGSRHRARCAEDAAPRNGYRHRHLSDRIPVRRCGRLSPRSRVRGRIAPAGSSH